MIKAVLLYVYSFLLFEFQSLVVPLQVLDYKNSKEQIMAEEKDLDWKWDGERKILKDFQQFQKEIN